MITKVREREFKLTLWHRVYFLLPRTILVDGGAYRVFRDYVWRRRVLHHWFEDVWWQWVYSLEEPVK